MNELVALSKRHPLCKICTVFEDDLLNDITLDIVLQRKTYKEICEYYSKLLPPNIPDINDINVRNHKRHCDPGLLAKEYLQQQGMAITPGEIAVKLYAEIYKDEIDKNNTLNELYRERIKNMQSLQLVLDEKHLRADELERALQKAKDEKQPDSVINDMAYRLKEIQGDIRSYIKQIDSMQGEVQDVILKEKQAEKTPMEGTIYVTQNYVNIFQVHMQSFLDELVPSMLQEFRDIPERGKKTIQLITSCMDRHIGSALDETKLLKYTKGKKILNGD